MKKILPAVFLMSLTSQVLAAESFPDIGTVHRYEGAINALIEPGAVIEQVTDDVFSWSEGPVWIADGGYVVFSDVPENTAWKWSESGGLDVFLRPSSYPDPRPRDGRKQGTNGLVMSLDGDILAADHGARSLIRIDPDTLVKIPVTAEYQGKRFNSPNDLVVSRLRWPGAVFFTDPPYGLKDQDKSALKEIDFNGVYRLDPDGNVTLLDDSLPRPNGIVLSPDERRLYVANSHRENAIWMVYELGDDGRISGEGRVFATAQAQLEKGGKGLPDGMAVDVAGNVWATGPGGVYVFDPDGRPLGLIETGTAIANCAFGGRDGSVLYMTSDGFLARIQTRTKGREFR